MAQASTLPDSDAAVPDGAPAAGTLKGELLTVLARPVARNALFSLLPPALLGLLALPHVPGVWIALWLAAVAAGQAARWRILPRLPTDDPARQPGRIQAVIVISLCNGALHALPVALFPAFDATERAVATILLCGVAVASMTLSMGYLPIYLAYMGVIMGALSAAWWWAPGAAEPDPLVAAMPLLLLFYTGLLVIGARQMFRVFRDSFVIRLQHLDLNRRLRAALAQAETANRAKTRFLASASHDLRQPIHTLSLFSAALSMRPLDERTRAIAAHLETAVGTLANQLDALLDVSKLDAGVVERHTERVGLRPLLARLCAEARPLCAERGLDLSLRCEGDPGVITDPLLLERILRNLLTNAVKYTDRGGVTLSALREDGGVRIAVADSGRGIPALERERIFEEFYQLDNPERDRTKGLGLGLAIVRRLTAMLDIDLDLRSDPGEGTTFELMVPDLDLPGDDRIAPTAASAAGSPPELAGHNLRVLVIDDEEAVRQGMRTLLEAMGFAVILADSGDRAMALASAEPPDIVLADFRLRGADDGLRAVAAIREQRPGMPALLISGDTAPDRLREARRAGLDLLHKPVPAGELRNAILRTCGREDAPD